MRDRDPRLGYQVAQLPGGPLDRLDPVVQVEHLPVAQQLAVDRRGHLPLVVRADERQHRVPFLRRRRDGGHLADAGDRHLQRARDRRGRHREHVHLGTQLLEELLVFHAEALLLVHHHEAELLEPGAHVRIATLTDREGKLTVLVVRVLARARPRIRRPCCSNLR